MNEEMRKEVVELHERLSASTRRLETWMDRSHMGDAASALLDELLSRLAEAEVVAYELIEKWED